MAVADFYKRGGKNFDLAYFHHGTPQANEMWYHVAKWANDNNVIVNRGDIQVPNKPKGMSPEEHWRIERYAWLLSIAEGKPIITCHHLDDACETWIFSALNGNPKVIAPVVKGPNILRPFLTTTKQDMIDWCLNHKVSWFEDKSNKDVSTPRNRIRHNIMPEAFIINPGLRKVVKKKIVALYKETK